MKKFSSLKSLFVCTLLFSAVVTGCSSKTGNADAKSKNTNEKKIVVYSAGPKGLAEKIQKDFEKKTGIKVEMFQGTTGKILARMEAEKKNPVVDVVVLASLPAMEGLKKEGQTLAYKEAKQADKLRSEWSDDKGHYFGYSASALGIVYNTKNVKTAPEDWSDITTGEWKGKVNLPDPALSGSALDFVTGYVKKNGKDGWNLFEQLKKNEVTVAGANQEALDPVVTGAKDMVIAGVDYMTYSAKVKGEPVDIVYPKSGTVISPRAAGIMKDSKNVEGAKEFIDYLLSDDVQKQVAKAYLLPGRTDIKAENRPNVEEIPVLNIDWKTVEKEQDEIGKQFKKVFQ
ncbi:extracellular solute-binding protein [Bacillus sp. AC79A.1]|uniref:ABC transporter substrate-binding protein n=1 Tax=Bacillus cereus HuB4-4 TaxID=1053211 RepID=A0A9W5QX20_BACCE|nr:ABC transporter substrate-binding protein [Bacillus cereus]EOP92202.1 ABC transporter substrate-binding protein [Bacillus cereus HuB4-4]